MKNDYLETLDPMGMTPEECMAWRQQHPSTPQEAEAHRKANELSTKGKIATALAVIGIVAMFICLFRYFPL